MYPELDKYYRPCGPCWFCGHKDKRHRLWDTFMDMSAGGDSPEKIAWAFDEPVDYIKAVLRIKPYKMMEQKAALKLIKAELESANKKFPLFNSSHEGYAVMLEEMDELWDEIKDNKHPMSSVNQKKEAIQVGAMAVKFLISCCKEHL